jgi:hypothetical protein
MRKPSRSRRARVWRLLGDILWLIGDSIGTLGYACYVRAKRLEAR